MSLPSPITFAPITGVVPCEPYAFRFTYTETDEGHVKGVTNMFSATVGDATTGTDLLTMNNGGAVYPGYWQLEWNPVKAGAGEYFIATEVLSNSNATYTTDSQLFTIEAGSDESCINATTTISLVLSSGTPVASGTATGTGIAAPSSAAERTQLTRGAIAGLIAGIIAILFGVLAAILFVRRRRAVATRVRRAQAIELPTYVPALSTYAMAIPARSPMAEMEKRDMDSKGEFGPRSDYDRESLRSVPSLYLHGKV
ncbi:hypothetical protein BD410DRAFT_826980 [Rickenella mellea]|uniref:Mid2 domain-containing protein n=1 Tax=Rickenella mellea TaxID=50990 RepID=A0A4Y7QC66_9AGAM|nr:hypothetical protein BD410DRAFT_826980 [Rickenella mellea]